MESESRLDPAAVPSLDPAAAPSLDSAAVPSLNPVVAPSLDSAALQVLLSRLAGIAQEMGVVLRRASFSPNIKERADCSSALFTPQGELLAQAEHIPVHLGSMPASVKAVLQHFADSCRPGDQFVVNDPFAGGTHLNDITFVAPCFSKPGASGSGAGELGAGVPSADGPGAGGSTSSQPDSEPQLLGWVANRAHHADIGGAAPGSMPADATEIFQEGLRIPPLRFTPEVAALIRLNSRTPAERQGDIDAQVGANVCGVDRLRSLCEAGLAGSQAVHSQTVGSQTVGSQDSGSQTVGSQTAGSQTPFSQISQSFSEVLAYGERFMRANLLALPDGTWRFQDVLDSFGPEPSQQVPKTVALAITISGDEMTFDFTGTETQVAGSVNAVRAVTESCVAFALRSATDPATPANGGAMRPITIITPPNSLVDATPPAAVGAGNVELSQRIADVCLGALAQIVPDKVGAASAGTMNNILIGGHGWVYYETVAAGQGARPTKDGMSGVHTAMTNTQNTPVEALERAYPMRVKCLKLHRGSGGAGRFRGGDGVQRDLELLEPAVVSLITERRQSQPWGLAGGQPGTRGENWLVKKSNPQDLVPLPDKLTFQAEAGDVVKMLTPGGGGWGDPAEREQAGG